MAEGDFKNYVIGFIFIAVFLFSILSFSVLMGNQYGKSPDQITAGALNLDPLQEHLENIEQQAQDQQDVFRQGSIWDIGGVIATTIFGIATTLFGFIIFPFQFINNILLDIFKISPLITGVIWGIIILSSIFAVWRLVTQGD